MTVWQICGVALAVLMFVLQAGKRGRGAVLAAALLFFSASVDSIARLFSFLGQQSGAIGRGGYATLLKALGIGLVCQFTAQLCREAGQEALASGVELFAKVQIVLLSVPLLQELLALAQEFSA